jgi:hypothetical protein
MPSREQVTNWCASVIASALVWVPMAFMGAPLWAAYGVGMTAYFVLLHVGPTR